ncbi:unnamed protein product [Sphagnum tenellum]
MSWKRYFRAVGTPNNNTQITNFAPSTANERGGAATSSKFSSYLPEVYAGHPNRIQRYYQYDDMDRDSDINAALDTIADFCTQSEEQNDEPFEIHYMGEPNETETQILKQALVKWTKINDFRSRLWHMFRNTIKNGDAFFLRDPETAEWLWIDTFMVEMVKVDDTAGKEPAEYIVRGLDYNKTAKFATIAADPSQYRSPLGSSNAGGARPAAPQQSSSVFSLAGTGADPRQRNTLSGIQDQIAVVDAEHVIHLSLSVETGKIMPGPITWAGQTRSNAKVVRLTLDNGETLNCTPDHKIPVIDKGYVEAKDITPDDRLFSSIDAAIEKIAQPTHITLIKYLDEPIDVGTLTIDGNEQYHGHHNFAISSGIFIKNSINDDYYFAMGCFRLNTTVPLLDGRILTFKALIEEYDQGKVNYTYSLNTKTHEFEPGKIAWAGITRRNAEMVRVTLDNGEHADCTPDHRFIMRDGSEVHAEDLKSGDSLMPLYRKASFSGKNQKNAKYERIVSNATGKSMFTHLLVQPKPPGRDYVVHHKDFSSTNNNPDNLEVMAWADHEALHKAVGTYSVGKQWATEAGRKNMILGMRNFHKVAITSEQKEEMRVRNRVNGAKVFNGKHAERIRQQGRDNLKKVNEIASLNYTIEMFDRLVEIYDSGVVSLRLIIPFLRQDENFQTLYAQANETTFRFKHHGKIGRIDDGHVNEIVRFAGFAGWDDFRSTHPKTEAVIAAIEYEKTRNAKQMHSLNASRTMNYTPEMFMRMVTMFNQGHNSISKLRRALMNDDIYQSLFQEANCSVTINKGTGGIVNARVLTQLSRVGGYNGWDDFKSTYAQNHKVVSVVRLSEREDTADLTIESPSDSHVFALGIGVYVHNSEGRGSKVETLPGGELVGEVGDLLLWSRKLARGLRIPTSYLPLGGEEEGGATYQDGKLGAAMIQEFRFSKYCMRIQSLLAPKFDASFKWFLRKNGIEIDESLFELRFLPPQNFTKYRQIELDAQQVGVYTQLAENKKLSERFKLKRYLNLTDEELLENEKLWSEENAAKLKKSTGTSPADNPSQDLGSVGVRGGDDFDMGGEEGEMPPEGEEGAMPPEGGAPGAAPPVGSPAPGAAPTGGAPPAGGGF